MSLDRGKVNEPGKSLERGEVKEPAKKRSAPPPPLRPETLDALEKTSEVCSEEAYIESTTPLAPTRPVISKPVLQNTTPNAACQIAKAPSTGVSQSSILASKKEKDTAGPLKPLRRAVFSDQIILPSPTSPNKPPIIHQPQSRDLEMCKKQTFRKVGFGKQRSSSLRCRPSNPPPKPPESLNNDASTANNTRQPGEVGHPLSSAEKSLPEWIKAIADTSEPIYDTILEDVEYQCQGHNGNYVFENRTDQDQENQFDQEEQGSHENQKEQENQVDLKDQENLAHKDMQNVDQNEQENQANHAKLLDETAKEDKEEDIVMGSSGDLLEMVQSELLSESIYSTNKLR